METASSAAPKFDLGDIYYVLFRQKWKILSCMVLGLVAAAGFYKLNPPPFRSDANLFVRFVISEGRDVGPGDGISVKSPEGRGDSIMNAELQIVSSRDLSETVARNVGPEKILAKLSGGRSVEEAASVVRGGLIVRVPPRTSTLEVSYQHPDPELVQPVLKEIVESYLRRHVEIHRAPGMIGDFLAQETDQLRARLMQTEEELRKLNNKAGVVSVEDAKKSYSAQIARLREAIFDAQAELAARSSIFDQLVKGTGQNNTSGDPSQTIPPDRIEAYRQVCTQVIQLQQREAELLGQFTAEVPRVRQVRTQLTTAEEQKKKLEAEFPAISQLFRPPATQGGRVSNYDPVTDAAQITAIQARMKTLQAQLKQVRAEASALDELEVKITELRRRKELEETNYRYYSQSLEQSRIKEQMGEGKVSNISKVQNPTPPYRDWTPVRKISGAIAGGGLALGLGWAFLIEFFMDRSVRRPRDVERVLRLPLFLSIPRLGGSSRSRNRLLKNAAPKDAGAQLAVVQQTATGLDVFHQTLRDRLISYFESINLRHKPKLVAVTGLGRGTGVTTTAAGLARTFSETGEGNVLLVDMTQGQGSAQHFHKGTQVELEQLFSTRNSALVQDNLYVVTEHSGSDRLAKGMPQRFNELVPKLKASDFDYIIFDMPPVNQISITPRLASFMDIVLMVVESEKTDRGMAERAAELLAQSKTNVGVVLNKTKSYVPSKLYEDRDLLGM